MREGRFCGTVAKSATEGGARTTTFPCAGRNAVTGVARYITLAREKTALNDPLALIPSIGMAVLGHRVIQSIGVELIKVTPSRGTCVELASSLVIVIGSVLGLPLSTSHCQVGAEIGVALLEPRWRGAINTKHPADYGRHDRRYLRFGRLQSEHARLSVASSYSEEEEEEEEGRRRGERGGEEEEEEGGRGR